VLLVPEGDASRRRHAHTACAVAARKAGRLPTIGEWRAASGEVRPGLVERLRARFKSGA
jgi:hypothetical protein